jgi:hypothetical protein
VAGRRSAAPAEAGEAAALRDMGDPAEVAREYAAVERAHPVRVARWGRGLLWAGIVLAILLVLQVFRLPTFGVVRWMDPELGGSFWRVSLWPLFRFYGDTNAGYVFDAAVGAWSYLLFPLIAFLLASAFWRALKPSRDTPSG